MRHHAKFHQNRSHCCRDGDLTVFIMANIAILDLLGACWDHPQSGRIGGLYRCAEFG